MNASVHQNPRPATLEKHHEPCNDEDDNTCEMSLSTMETDPAELAQQSFSDMGLLNASLDLNRHNVTISDRTQHRQVRVREPTNADSTTDGFGESFLGESFFGDSFAVPDDGDRRISGGSMPLTLSPSPRAKAKPSATMSQLAPVLDDEDEEDAVIEVEDDHDDTEDDDQQASSTSGPKFG